MLENFRFHYPETFIAVFISESGETITNTHNGYLEELERLSDENLISEGASLRQLRPLTDLKPLMNSKSAFLHNVEILPMDTVLHSGGNGHQDALVNTEISASRSANDTYLQSQFKNAIMPQSWQPNFIRPTIKVGGKTVLRGLSGNSQKITNIVDLSIGEITNRCLDIHQEFNHVDSLEIQTACGQIITGEGKIKNYPVIMRLEFWLNDKSSETIQQRYNSIDGGR